MSAATQHPGPDHPAPATPLRLSWGGDEFLFVEVAQEMDLAANFRAAAIVRLLQERRPAGIVDLCPSNASLLVRIDPDVLDPAELERLVLAAGEETADLTGQVVQTRIIEVPVWYDDPHTREVGERFRDNRHEPDLDDLEFAAARNGLADREAFVARHHGSPWMVTMVGFVAGLPFMYQMVPREEQLEVPKYVLPRTDTPKLTVGHGGCFSCIYSVRGAGGYQMFGLAAAPIYDPAQALPDFADSVVLFRPGDVVVYRPVTQERYETIQAEVAAGTWRYRTRPVTVDLAAAAADPHAHNARLLEALDGA